MGLPPKLNAGRIVDSPSIFKLGGNDKVLLPITLADAKGIELVNKSGSFPEFSD